MILLFVSGLAPSADAGSPVKKLGRGACNVITCPLELPEQMVRVYDPNGPFAAITYGLIKGVLMTGARGAVGIYEIVTFPFPVPAKYAPILTDPEFFLEDSGKPPHHAAPAPSQTPDDELQVNVLSEH